MHGKKEGFRYGPVSKLDAQTGNVTPT